MTEGEPLGVQRMPAESDRAERVGAVGIALLADQRVAAQSRLDANLITSPGFESNLEQRGIAKGLERRVFTNRIRALGIEYGDSFHAVGNMQGPGIEAGARGDGDSVYAFDPSRP